ncbi:MAG: T9SS type A sorting domain-containing protein [Ignavibacteria bacterium]|nr:T9SS type A sorting domain-containing protein [Ignavibacteria bacterium]
MFATSTSPPNSGVINVDGTSYGGALTTTDVTQINGLPNDFSLSQNYPNPFNPSTNIQYSIPEASFVELKVYDVLGNEVATLVSEQQTAGVYRADFSGNGLASGLYIARITSGNYTSSIKMTLMK